MREKIKLVISFFAFLFMLWGVAGAGPGLAADVQAYLPASGEVAGWTMNGEPESFKGEDLFRMINGGADVYHEYGFRQVVRAAYRDARGKSVKLEIYEMKDPAAAYGIFTFKAGDDGKALHIGQAALLQDYYLNFWKGDVLATLVASDTDAETVKGMLALAKAVAARIKKTGEIPGLAEMLTREPFALTHPKFVRGPLGVMRNYMFDTKNIFRVREGVIGNIGGCRAFVFGYLDIGQSAEIFAQAASAIRAGKRFSNVVHHGDGLSMLGRKKEHILAVRNGRYIVIVMGQDDQKVKAASKGLNQKLAGK